jgi:hypothetical protein
MANKSMQASVSREEVVSVIVIALAVAGLSAAGFVMVVAGIRRSERRMGLGSPPRGCADVLARRVLGAHSCPSVIASRRTAASRTWRCGQVTR